jgi:hypothetical protein
MAACPNIVGLAAKSDAANTMLASRFKRRGGEQLRKANIASKNTTLSAINRGGIATLADGTSWHISSSELLRAHCNCASMQIARAKQPDQPVAQILFLQENENRHDDDNAHRRERREDGSQITLDELQR